MNGMEYELTARWPAALPTIMHEGWGGSGRGEGCRWWACWFGSGDSFGLVVALEVCRTSEGATILPHGTQHLAPLPGLHELVKRSIRNELIAFKLHSALGAGDVEM